eukprot:865009-Lingulodinium_polyedra.AAC.2
MNWDLRKAKLNRVGGSTFILSNVWDTMPAIQGRGVPALPVVPQPAAEQVNPAMAAPGTSAVAGAPAVAAGGPAVAGAPAVAAGGPAAVAGNAAEAAPGPAAEQVKVAEAAPGPPAAVAGDAAEAAHGPPASDDDDELEPACL